MKILLSNYRYFISGGPERYMFNIQSRLEHIGHEIIPFSIHYEKNKPSPYSEYFVNPIGNSRQVYYDQHSKSVSTFLKTISRLFYSTEVEKAVMRLSQATSPDIAYVLHYLRKLSPSLLVGLKKSHTPIIVRLSDYMMLCPQSHCLRNTTPCSLCLPDKLLPSLQHKCVKESYSASLLNLCATWYHRKKHFFDLVDSFVCTNSFMYDMMLKAGYPEKRLACIPTFTNSDHFQINPLNKKSDYFVYVGRITPIKGLHILLQAMGKLPKPKLHGTHLKIAGTGEESYITLCKNAVFSLNLEHYVEFLGEVETELLPSLLNQALFSIVPSLWFENLPNSILESYSCGTPVLASDIGSLTDCVNDGKTGFLFAPGNTTELASKIEYCLSNPGLLKSMTTTCRQEVEAKYSPEKHINSLLNLFSSFT